MASPASNCPRRLRKESWMSGVRVLVGTRKGAFVLTSDEKRERWDVCGPHFAGWEMYHLKGSSVDPNRLYASQSSGWFGQTMQRSDDGGRTWNPVGNEFVYDGVPGTHQWYDGTQHPWAFARVWHLEPSLSDPDTVYAGVEDAALFRSTDGGESWQELSGLREVKGNLWQPGAGGMCLHTIVLDPNDPNRIVVAISAAGAFRTDDGVQTCCSCRSTWTSCARTTPASAGTRLVGTCRATSDSRLPFTLTSRRRSTSFRSRATPSTFRPKASS